MKRFYRDLLIGFSLIVTALFVYTHILPGYFPLQGALPQDDLQGYYDPEDVYGTFHGTKTISQNLLPPEVDEEVLGYSNDNKRIEVDLTNQRLYAFEGDNKVYDFIISSGLFDWTPRGEFRIWIKLRYTLMTGGSQALGTYYYLPNVPYTMYFYNEAIPKTRGFGIHGTYWHNDFGRPKSHGCVNLRTEDAERLFYWATPHLGSANSVNATVENPGTRILIYGKYGG